MRLIFHPAALQEYADAVNYYAQIRIDLAQTFINHVENTVNQIRESPNRYPVLKKDIRKAFIQKFPYTLLYRFENETILIFALMHHSRKPGYWLKRIS